MSVLSPSGGNREREGSRMTLRLLIRVPSTAPCIHTPHTQPAMPWKPNPFVHQNPLLPGHLTGPF